MIEKIFVYLSYAFVQYAIIVGALISVCSSLLGVTLVLKRYSLIGDGLSHVAFGAMCVAAVANVTENLYVIMPVTVVAALILLCFGDKLNLKGDAAIAMMSVTALAFGYLIVNVFSASANVSGDVCSTLFGSMSILTLTSNDLILSIVMSLLVALVFILFNKRIFAVTFDESFMRAAGLNARLFDILIAVVTAIVISLSMRLVGSLLITALIIFPSMSAMRLFKSYRSVIIFSVCFGAVASIIGILFSIAAGTPVGSTIVLTDFIAFLICSGIGKLLTRKKIGNKKRLTQL